MLLETFLGGIVEIVLFMVLLHKNNAENDLIPVIQAAILGSILANLLLCLGFCFFVGGLNRHEQDFEEAISEVGSGLMLVAGFGLLIPAAFYQSLQGSDRVETPAQLDEKVLKISRITSVILLVAFLLQVLVHLSVLIVLTMTPDTSGSKCTRITAYMTLFSRKTNNGTLIGTRT